MKFVSEHDGLSELSSQLCVLGSNARLSVLLHLREREMSVGELAAKLEFSQSALSQHLKKLRDCQLVTVRRQTQNRFYSINHKVVESVIGNMSFFNLLIDPISDPINADIEQNQLESVVGQSDVQAMVSHG